MSTENDVARSLRSWLRENRHEDANRVLDAVFDQVPATPQRPAPWLARRFLVMNTNIARLGVVAAAVALAIIIGINFLPGSYFGGPPKATPSPSEAAPSPSAAASPKALPILEAVALTPGRYSLEGFPVPVTFDVPAGWVACSPGPVEQSTCQSTSLSGLGVAVAFTIIDNVVADPCGTDGALLNPPVGPSVDDLVTAISNLQGFEATTPVDVTIDGFAGKQFTLTSPSAAACGGLKTWTTKDRTNGMSPGEVQEMRILDVGGVRVVIAGVYFPSIATADQRSALQQVIASIQIQP